jgi:hypothetical protein
MAVASGGLAAVATLGTGGVAHAAQTFTVTNLNNSGTGSLRAAIHAANADATDTAAPGDSIVFASSLTGTLALSTADNSTDSLYVDRPVQIRGPGANRLTIRADPGHRVLEFIPTFGVTSMDAKLSGLTLSGGSGVGSGAGIRALKTRLELDAMAISGNTGTYVGGISLGGTASTLVMNGSTVSGNAGTLPLGTGGVYSMYGGTVNDSTITGNSGGSGGGGIDAYSGPLTVTGSTVAGNTVRDPTGGQVQSDFSTMTLKDSIVSGSGTAPDVVLATSKASGTASFSLIRNASAVSGGEPISTDATDIIGKDPQLGPLQFNGGPTETMVPAPTSPVLDHGKSFGLTADQRGLSRPFGLPTIASVPAGGDRSDIGAVEEHTASVAAISPSAGGAGTHMAIAGTGFTGATHVLFGSIPASSFKVLDDGAMTAVAPVNVETQDVRVVTPLGESPVVAADRFTFPTFTPTIGHPHPKLHGRKLNTGVTVDCPIGGLTCKGSFKATTVIEHHGTKLAHGEFDIAPGQGDTTTFKLSNRALHALKRAGKLKIALEIVIADGTEQPTTVKQRFTLKHRH